MTGIKKTIITLAFTLCLTVVMVLFASCSEEKPVANDNSKGDSEMSLNERQMIICEDLGLPVTYEELTESQKITINRIEELLQYLDDKYDTSFNYLGYNEPFLEQETLKAYTDGFSEFEYTTLTVKEDGSFEDDYPFQFVKRIVQADFTEYLQNNTEYAYKVFVIGGKTDLTDIAKINKDALSGTTEASCTIFVDQSKDVDVQTVKEAVSGWYQSAGIYGNANVIAVDHDTFENITFDNYESVKREQHLSNLFLCEVSSSGNATFY